MLEQVDLELKISKEEFRSHIEPLRYRVSELQRECREAGIPIAVVFEGWDAAGKGTCINLLMRALDPRGFRVYPLGKANEDEALRPFLWRYAVRIPHHGYIAIFDRSWYTRVLSDRVENEIDRNKWRDAYEEIICFERQLVDDGAVLVKFWLHISKKEQEKRFRKMEKDPLEAWKVTAEDWRQHKHYEEYAEAVEEMLQKTSTAGAPWTIVESETKYFGRLKIFETLIRAMEDALNRHAKNKDATQSAAPLYQPQLAKTVTMKSESFLKRFDLTQVIDPSKYEKTMDDLQEQARQIHHRMFLDRVAAVAVFEGWDAAGKGGAIKRLLANLDPRGFEVATYAAPTAEERVHHYLWRFWTRVPKAGHLTIYDRSWYGRVLVERVEGFCSIDAWQRAYKEINEFERSLTNAGIVVVKFWLQIDKDEQLRRFKAREGTPYKQWKITEEDWRNREKWEAYELAVADMVQRTSTTYAPWTVVESNDKLFSRVKVMQTFVKSVGASLTGRESHD